MSLYSTIKVNASHKFVQDIYSSKVPGVNQYCSLFAAFRAFLNITSFILFQYLLKVKYEIPVRKSIKYRIWMAIYFTCHLFTHAYINKTINKTLYTHYPRWAISFMTYINLLFCQVRIPDVLNNISSYSVYRGLVLLHSVSLSLSFPLAEWEKQTEQDARAQGA